MGLDDKKTPPTTQAQMGALFVVAGASLVLVAAFVLGDVWGGVLALGALLMVLGWAALE